MDIEDVRQRTAGIVVFAVTPMREEWDTTVVDEDGVRRNTEFLAAAGIPCAVVCGGVGELWDLTEAEHLQVVRAAAEQAGDRMAVYAGVCGGREASVARARKVEAAGAHGVLLFPDEEAVPDAAALLDYYTRLSQAVGLALMPFRADAWVDIPLLQRLCDLPNVVALKEERENMAEFRQIVLALGERLQVIGAGDEFLPCYALLGGAGVACSLSNFLPALYAEMWEAARHWDYRRLMEIHASLVPITELRRRNGTSLLKAAMEMLGLAGGPCRAGQRWMDPADRERLRELLESSGLVA
ncbi:MAG: dihydrodipicolinate synthase family protein [Candidatus Latescibacterota bacterium]